MASIVAYIEVREGAITPASILAIGESRRIAQAVGATVYAFLAIESLPESEIDRLAEQVSAAGADRVLCCSNQALAGPHLDASHGPVLAQLADRLRPVLVLFPAGGVGCELGPPLAIRIGAAYVPSASVEIHTLDSGQGFSSHRILLTRWRAAGDGLRRIDVGDFERPVVAALTGGSEIVCSGEPCAELETLPYPAPESVQFRILGAVVDPTSEIESCPVLLLVPALTSTAERDSLRTALPPDVCLRGEDDRDLDKASPGDAFLLSLDPSQLPVHAQRIVRVSGSATELAAALQRLQSVGGGTPK